MSKTQKERLSTSVLFGGAIAGAIILCGQAVSWATTACQVPNPNTVYCTSSQITYTCASNSTESTCTLLYDSFERNQFPDGGADSSSGTTKQEQADCWRRKYCSWNTSTSKCESGSWGSWIQGDKTVTGTNPCPTEEG